MNSNVEHRVNLSNDPREENESDLGLVVAEIRRRVDQQALGKVISALFENVESEGDASEAPGG